MKKVKNLQIVFKKYSVILFLGLISTVSNLQAQNMSFQKLYCTTEFTIRYFLPMQTGSIFVAGDDTLDYANKKSTAVLKKYDKDFNIIWEKKFGGSQEDNFDLIKYIGDNRLLVRGTTNSQDGDVQNNYPYGQNEWVCVFDTNGNMLHQLIYGADGSSTISNSIKIGPNGDFYFCGNTYGDTFDFIDKGPFDFQDDGYIACADSQLNKKWLKFYEVNNGDSFVRDVEFLPNGRLLLVCNSNIKDGAFAVNTPTSSGGTIVMEIDTFGTVYWQKRYGASNPNPIILDGVMGKIYRDANKQEFYLTGACSSKTGDCWDSYPYLNSPDQNYQWIMKVDTLGNKIWSHIFGPFSDSGITSLESATELFNNNAIQLADGVSGSDNYAFGTQIGKKDTWLINIDSNGVLYKHNRIGYPNVNWIPFLVNKNPVTSENYYLYREAKAISNPIVSPNGCDTSTNLYNNIIGKYNYWPDKILENSIESLNLRVFPNPARNEINIQELEKGTQIEIYNADGKKLVSIRSTKPKEAISVAGWQRGIYVIKASHQRKLFTQKVILQ